MKITFKHEIKTTENIDSKKLLDIILLHRKIKDINGFIKPKSPLDMSIFDFDKKYKANFKKVIKILSDIKKNKKMIVVYTDYDADGITGGAILWETLHLLGFSVMPYVPDRKIEGYGFSIYGIDKVKKQFDPALIISVDHGITKIKEISYAKSLGIKTIVTDHHLKGEKIPSDAEAIFHIPALSGSGVSYFFSKEVYMSFRGSETTEKSSERKSRSAGFLTSLEMTKLAHNFEIDYLALATIGIIADLVPLTGPSRSVVKHGLSVFPKIKRHGIKQLLKQAGIEDKVITPYEVGFMIAPRINAIGRLSHAIEALRLLCTNDEKRAYELSQKIGSVNIDRQELVEKSVKEAKKIINEKWPDLKKLPKIIILESNHWHEGIIGLIASKLVEEFYRPTIILTKNGVNYKASARSIIGFNITDFLKSLKEHLVDVGGHAAAAGFSIEQSKYDNFVKAATKLADKLIKNKDLEKTIVADLKIPVSKINLELIKSLETFEPYGIGNPRPVFLSEVQLSGASYLGKTQKHLKLYVTDSNQPATADNRSLELIAFNMGDKFKELSRGTKTQVIYTLEIDRWGGREKLKGKITWISDKFIS